ncbi:MAG: hypothetical protein J6S82_10625 [Bacteroidales bacterium]|nr:hypothetical protein [Bacteroidales bacterium]
MALTDENGGGIPATMLVSPSNMGSGMPYPVPMYGNQGSGNNGFGDNGWWIILLFILIAAMGGNWGGNNNGGGMMGSGAPIVINDSNGGSVQRGFDQAAVMSGLNGIQSGISGLSTQLCGCCCDMQNTVNNGFANVQQSLCSGFAGVNATVNGAQNALAQQMYTNTISDLERSFANQTAITQGMNGIQSQLAQCCCDNRLATNDLKYTIAQENCADRAAISDGIRDLLTAQTAGFQSIKDLLFEDRLDEKNDRIASLERQLTAAQLNASQIAQTAQIVDQTYNRLSTCPVGTVPVYGEQPIFTCRNNNNCGCGCGNNF